MINSNIPEKYLIYYETRGRGEPLLLIAGLASDSSSWAGVIEGFSSNFRTVVFDNRGCGRSEVPDRTYIIKDIADDAVGLLEALGIKRCHVLGHSMGGYIAQEIAINYPERVKRLVLASTSFVSSERNNGLFKEILKILREGDYEAWVRSWVPWLFSKKAVKDKKFVNAFIRSAVEYPYHQTAEGLRGQIDAIAAFNSRERAKNIEAATLLLEGEEDCLILPDEAAALAKNIPRSKLRLLKNTGHCLHIENRKDFMKETLAFLAFS